MLLLVDDAMMEEDGVKALVSDAHKKMGANMLSFMVDFNGLFWYFLLWLS